MSLRILVTGRNGQLGRDLINFLSTYYIVKGVDIDDFDIRNYKAAREYITRYEPDIVLHCAAFTDVDACESDVKTALDINATGTENIANVCQEIDARIIYYSTDYVFDGEKYSPYTEEDRPNPKTVYGISKYEGEKYIEEISRNHAIMRIAWLYGANGRNFIKTMIKLGLEQLQNRAEGKNITPFKVVNDQIGDPTWTMEIAKQTKLIIDNNLIGLFHCTSNGEISWYQFAKLIFEYLSMDVTINPCTTAEFPRPAPRPKYTGMENLRLKNLGLNIMRFHEQPLKEFLEKFGERLKDEL